MSVSLAPAALREAQPRKAIWSSLITLALVCVAALVHSYNMFGFPLYLGDEGIYMSQAYAVARLGSITPYAYWYDHAPAGWILIALWTMVTGGFHTFGTAIDSGRTLMLLLHIISLVLLFRIVLHLTGSNLAAAIGGLVYALSPLTVVYGRMVLLDNIMIVFVLAGTLLLVNYDGLLWRLFVGSLLIGIGALSKESALVLLPVLIIGVWTLTHAQHRPFARGVWLFGVLATISLYPLYAALRGELLNFSFSSPLNGDGSGVTLLGAVLWQVGRSGGVPWDPQSDFMRVLTGSWLARDPWLLGVGLVAAIWNLVRGDGRTRLIAGLGLVACLSLMRGGPVLEFYIIGVLPFLALNVGLAAARIADLTRMPGLLLALLIGIGVLGVNNLNRQSEIFTLNMTTTQRQALAWVRQHVPADAQIVIDDDLWVDLRDGPAGQPDFPGAHSHWKVANDPAVYRELFNNDWRNIDYLITTPGLEEIFKQNPEKLPYQAWSNSTAVARFNVGDAAIEVRRVNHAGIAIKDTVRTGYASFVASYVQDGRVVGAGAYTDVRDQTSAMLMAVWQNDQATFDALWAWAQLRLQAPEGHLLHTNEPGIALHTYADANAEAALALLLAERRWNDASYGREGLRIARALWERCVVEIDGRPYLAAGDWAIEDDRFIFAPGSFVPYAIRMFAEVDAERNWWWLLDNTYALLTQVSATRLGEERSVGLPPTYVALDRTTGAIRPDQRGLPGMGVAFGDEAALTYWRVALDAHWFDDERSDRYLRSAAFLFDEWQRKGALAGRYGHNGTVQSEEESLLLYSAVLPVFLTQNQPAGHTLYATRIATAYTNTPDGVRWGNGKSVAEQRWAWLSSAFYLDILDYAWED
ncbi:MAG: glycosyl hydrolase family 8 [Chloroflexaceae bacterium]